MEQPTFGEKYSTEMSQLFSLNSVVGYFLMKTQIVFQLSCDWVLTSQFYFYLSFPSEETSLLVHVWQLKRENCNYQKKTFQKWKFFREKIGEVKCSEQLRLEMHCKQKKTFFFFLSGKLNFSYLSSKSFKMSKKLSCKIVLKETVTCIN